MGSNFLENFVQFFPEKPPAFWGGRPKSCSEWEPAFGGIVQGPSDLRPHGLLNPNLTSMDVQNNFVLSPRFDFRCFAVAYVEADIWEDPRGIERAGWALKIRRQSDEHRSPNNRVQRYWSQILINVSKTSRTFQCPITIRFEARSI
jgi:hypothetical protein